MPSQGVYTLEHIASFRQLKHMEPLSFDRSHIGSWGIENLHICRPLTIEAGEGLHLCILNFFKIFSMYAFCDSPNTPFISISVNLDP